MDGPGAAGSNGKATGSRRSPRDIAVIAWLSVTAALSTWGFIQGWVFTYADGWYGNYFTTVWLSGFAWVLCIQAGLVFCKPQLTTARPARFWVWQVYAFWMFACCLIILVGLGIGLTGQFPWAFLWLPGISIIAYGSWMHKRAASTAVQPPRVDVETEGTQQKRGCCSAGPRVHWNRFLAFCGWSSIFWLVIIGFFLALQAAWLAADAKAYPAPGQIYAIPLDGSTYVPKLHIFCKGPKTAGKATIVMEGGGGSPGVSYAPIVDALAAAGRRACWYDRLGYGWSDDIIKPTTTMRNTAALKSLLTAAGEAGPYVIAGHSAGGQLALLFAATYPADTAGVALLDSYSDAAIALQWMNAKNVTVNLPDGTTVTRPDVTRMTAATGASDLLRVVTPLAWSRFITMKPATSSWLAAMNAAYGSNKVWHSQWVELLSMAQPTITPLADELSKRSGRARFWNGVSWPSLGAKPVLLLPAAKTLNLPAGCDPATLATDTACQAKVAADAKNYYANLYLVYKDTLGTDVTLSPLPGDHAVWQDAPDVANALLAKFANV